MPVSEISKAAGVRCCHQRHGKGCAAYADRPLSCREWSCLWLTDPATEALRRPDRSGYVLDSLPDFSRARNENTGAETVFEVVQIWASDRGVKIEAELIPYLEARHAGAAIRSESAGVVVMVPPWVSPTGGWLLQEGTISEPQHTVEQVGRALRKGAAPQR